MTTEQLDRGYELQEEIQGIEHELSKLKTWFFEPTNELFLHTMKGASHYVTVPERLYGAVYDLLCDGYTTGLRQAKDDLANL